MTVSVFQPGLTGFFDSAGAPLASGTAEFYREGTTTLKSIYGTRSNAESQSTAIDNPATLDASGRVQAWLEDTGLYKVVIKDSSGSTVITIDEYGDEGAGTLPRNYIAGLKTSNGTDGDHDVDIAVGECRDDADSFDIVVGAEITIAIDAAAGANAIDTGSVAADTSYAVWVIADSSGTNATAGVFSTSFSSPTLPSGYDKKRLVGFVITDGSSNIIAYVQSGDYFELTGDTSTDVDDSTITNITFETGTLKVPPNCLAFVYTRLFLSGAGAGNATGIWLKRNGSSESASTPEDAAVYVNNDATPSDVGGRVSVMVDGSSQIQYAATEVAGAATLTIETVGCMMLTRREP